jgi:hypothetical protein
VLRALSVPVFGLLTRPSATSPINSAIEARIRWFAQNFSTKCPGAPLPLFAETLSPALTVWRVVEGVTADHALFVMAHCDEFGTLRDRA